MRSFDKLKMTMFDGMRCFDRLSMTMVDGYISIRLPSLSSRLSLPVISTEVERSLHIVSFDRNQMV
ncbi:hypothetical protein [Massilibacteroides vaginae]|uniref:hypothetical protein n=1 Tax=Massilibacteroides vaginae TaxID=1673718 RepID=UPI00111BE08A|nr:hypothetical protein [Massilibacteroides vaginae]